MSLEHVVFKDAALARRKAALDMELEKSVTKGSTIRRRCDRRMGTWHAANSTTALHHNDTASKPGVFSVPQYDGMDPTTKALVRAQATQQVKSALHEGSPPTTRPKSKLGSAQPPLPAHGRILGHELAKASAAHDALLPDQNDVTLMRRMLSQRHPGMSRFLQRVYESDPPAFPAAPPSRPSSYRKSAAAPPGPSLAAASPLAPPCIPVEAARDREKSDAANISIPAVPSTAGLLPRHRKLTKARLLRTQGSPRTQRPAVTCETEAVPSEAVSLLPPHFVCPITRVLMKHPVLLADGFSYEREAAERWLLTSTDSPSTGAPLSHTELLPNHVIKSLICEYEEQLPARARQ
jgi:hypothetical protein